MSDPNLDERLTEELKRALAPVKPPEAFRDHLRHNLELAGRQQVVRRGRMVRRRPPWAEWWIMVVLMGGSIAAGSVLAYIIRSRFPFKQPA
ncbi:MAG: hypothetical protein ACM3JD_00975 [Rudaea sp.]